MADDLKKILLSKLEQVSKDLRSQEKSVVSAIAKAREFGDLSENAEYKAAKEEQAKIARQIKENDDMIDSVKNKYRMLEHSIKSLDGVIEEIKIVSKETKAAIDAVMQKDKRKYVSEDAPVIKKIKKERAKSGQVVNFRDHKYEVVGPSDLLFGDTSDGDYTKRLKEYEKEQEKQVEILKKVQQTEIKKKEILNKISKIKNNALPNENTKVPIANLVKKLNQMYGSPQIRRGNAKINALDAKPISPDQLSTNQFAFIPMRLDTSMNPDGTRNHKYYIDSKNKKWQKEYEKYYKDIPIMSVTGLGGLVTGNEIGKMRSDLEKYQERYKNNGLSAPEIKKMQKLADDVGRIDNASEYGTTFHRAIELLEKEKINLSDEKQVADFVKKIVSSEGLSFGSYTNKNQKNKSRRIEPKNIENLLSDIGAYSKWKQTNKMAEVAGSEMSLGAAVNIGGKTRLIGGTLDQMFLEGMYGIRDLKTTSASHPAYGLQLSLLSKMARAAGFDLPSGIGLTRISGGEVYSEDFKELTDELVIQILEKAYEIVEAQTEDAKKASQKEAEKLLGSGGKITRIGESEFKGVKYKTYDDSSLNRIGKRWKNEKDDEKAKARIFALYDSLKNNPNQEELDKFFGSIYSIDKGTGSFYKSGEIWDWARANLPNKYNMEVSEYNMGTKEFQLKNGETASGLTLGGMYTSEILKKRDMLLKENGEEAAQQYMNGVLSKLDEIIGNKMLNVNSFQEAQMAEKFVSNLISRDDSFANMFPSGSYYRNENFKNISNIISDSMLSELGGEMNYKSKEEQEMSAYLSSINKMQNALKFLDYFKKQMSELGSGSLPEIIQKMSVDLQNKIPISDVMKKYENELSAIYKGFDFVKNNLNDAIRNLGSESELNQFGNEEIINLSEQTIDSAVSFRKDIINYIKNSKIPQVIKNQMISEIGKSLGTNDNGGAESAAWRLSRSIGASDYILDVLGPSIAKGNQNGMNIPAGFYIENLLSPEALMQYKDSEKMKNKFLSYADKEGGAIEFLKDFINSDNIGDGKEYQSRELYQLKKQISGLFQAYGDDILNQVVEKLVDILFKIDGDDAIFDLTKRFSSFDKGGARQSVLSGRGIGYYSSQDTVDKDSNSFDALKMADITKEEIEFMEKYNQLQNDNELSKEEKASILREALDKAFLSYKPGTSVMSKNDRMNAIRAERYHHDVEKRYGKYIDYVGAIPSLKAAKESMSTELDNSYLKPTDGNVFVKGYYPGIGSRTYLMPSDVANKYKPGDEIINENNGKFIFSEILDKVVPFSLKAIKDGKEVFATIDDYKQFLFKKEDTNKKAEKKEEAQTVEVKAETATVETEEAKLPDTSSENSSSGNSSSGGDGDGSGSGKGGGGKKSDSDKEKENALRKYNDLLGKQVKLEADIEQYKLRTNTTSGKESQANEGVLKLLEQQKAKLDEQIAVEEQLEVIKNSQEAAEMRETRDLERQIALSKKLAANRGNVTLRDVITRDIQNVGFRIANFGLASRLISKLPQSLQKIKQNTMQLEEALMNLRVVTGYNRKDGEALLVTYNKLSKQLGATTVEVANAADAWLRQGYAVDETEKLIDASMKLSKLGKIDSAQATKSLKIK